MFKRMVKKIIAILRKLFLLNRPYVMYFRFSCGLWQELNKQTLEVASIHDQAGGQYNFMAKELQLISEDHAKKAQTVSKILYIQHK